MTVVYVWVEDASERLAKAQIQFEKSLDALGLNGIRHQAGRKLSRFVDVLKKGRQHCQGEAFVWCNSDLIMRRSPFDVPNPKSVYGFYRTEIPSGEITRGVDMYYIPVEWWDEYLSKDAPDLYLGASYVDWWISHAMQKQKTYDNLSGYIDHITHPRSSASGSEFDNYYQHNFRVYNSWAKRNNLSPIPLPPYILPKIGHVWGIRDAFRKVLGKTNH